MTYKKIELNNNNTPNQVEEGVTVDVSLEDITSAPETMSTPEDKGVQVDLISGETNEVVDKEAEKVATPVEDETTNTANKSAAKGEKRVSRAQKRIKQLHTEKTDLQKRLEQAEADKIALEAKVQEGSKTSKENIQTSLETQLSALTSSLKTAMEEGNTEEVVRIQDDMITAKMQLAGVQSELNRIKAEPTPTNQPQTQAPAPQIPEKALDWIEDYPQFQTDELFYVASITVSNQLVNEGFDDTSDDFYSELTERLSPRFPEVFGVADENSVKYTQAHENADSSNTTEGSSDVKDSPSAKKDNVPQVEQTVSGASRTPPHQGGKKSSGKSESVVLSPQMVTQAERWGLTLEQMARRVAHKDRNSKGGYTPIFIKDTKK